MSFNIFGIINPWSINQSVLIHTAPNCHKEKESYAERLQIKMNFYGLTVFHGKLLIITDFKKIHHSMTHVNVKFVIQRCRIVSLLLTSEYDSQKDLAQEHTASSPELRGPIR